MTPQRKDRRGVALVVVAIFLALLLGITAVGIDVGRLAHTATEVQTVADAAARGGAQALLDSGGTPGDGIIRAHLIAGKNNMDGDPAPSADVAVDEGFYDVTTNDFECCTSNSPCCANGSWGDQTCTTAADCGSVSAVLAIPRVTVTNLFAGVFDFMQNGRLTTAEASGSPNKTTPIEKLAIAMPGGPGAGCQVPEGCTAGDWGCYCSQGVAPCLPITAPACEFPPGCNGIECQLPTLLVSPNGNDTAAWTGFDQGDNANTIRSFLAQGPCDPPGQNNTIPPTVIGPVIGLNNGINPSAQNHVFDLTRCLAGLNAPPENQPQGCEVDGDGNIITTGTRGAVFTIPIVDSNSSTCSDNFVQSRPVVGFATIRITAVSTDNPRSVSIETISNTTSTGTAGGGLCFGTDCRVALVK